MPEFEGAATGDGCECDEVAEARERADLAKDLGSCRVEEQDAGLELGTEIVGEAVEEAAEHRMRALQGSYSAIGGRGDRCDIAADRRFQRKIGQDEYRCPVIGHMVNPVGASPPSLK